MKLLPYNPKKLVLSHNMSILPNISILTIDLTGTCNADNSHLGIVKPSIGASLALAVSKKVLNSWTSGLKSESLTHSERV